MKSKKSKRKTYSRQDLDTRVKMVLDTSNPDKPMIDRKATQANIDMEKKVKHLLSMNAYNINQIAAMLGIHAEKVKRIKDGS